MKLIADSGSTKTSWRLIGSRGSVQEVETSGMNPFFRTSEDIEQELNEKLLPLVQSVQSVFFYGSGIINEEKASIIRTALQQVFGEISIELHSDLVGAARSVCGEEPGIACILGTGSNACLFDGEKIIDNIPPLGFILGDEGSGTHFGKQLLGDFFKRIMPEDLQANFQGRFEINKDIVLEKTYRQPKSNQYLAGFSIFVSENIESCYCQQLVKQSFHQFIQRNVKTISGSDVFPINFVGSIAYFFREILKEVLNEEQLIVGKIIKEPVDGLISYHENKGV
ncbi:ATPase [Sunxiuqinia sp. A32]|uniref:ATPase n=1 Tax=Sunxiuqinia sp. A32 TaxID=3461496 RepID=UPI00404572C9